MEKLPPSADKNLDEISISSSSRNASVSSTRTLVAQSVSLEDGTSVRITAFSRGFAAGRFLDRDKVPCIPVTGTQIRNHSGLSSSLAKQLQTYHVKRVLSPFEFYLERESDTKCEEQRLRHEKMQKHYESQEMEAFEYSIKVSKMSCYAYYDRHSKSWWRVQVQDFEFDDGITSAYIYYCDTGKQEYIMCEHLRQLDEKFEGAWDSAILKCYLYDVVPISGDLNWSIDAIAYFKELISNQRLGAIVLKMCTESVVEYSPHMTVHCGVVLTEKVDPTQSPDTINWLMVKMGYGRSIGIMSSSPDVLNIQGLVPCFNIPEHTEEPTLEKSTEISREELRNIVARAMSSSGPAQRYFPVHDERPSQSVNTPDDKFIPFNIRVRLAWMKMSFVESPSKIFIHTRNKLLELRAMETEMRKVCQKHPQPTLLEPGAAVTCDLKDSMDPDKDSWGRAVVLEIDLAKQAAKVLLVDYGSVLKVHFSVVYQLPDKYRLIPSFVHRVHLSDILPNYYVPEWDETINRVFFQYIISHEVDLPVYFVHLEDNADTVKFTDVNQGLFFSDMTNKWMANCPEAMDENAIINSMRDDPLLATYFCSRAVQIFYEVAADESGFWKCENLSDYLVKREYAQLVKPQLNKDRVHEILKKGFGSL